MFDRKGFCGISTVLLVSLLGLGCAAADEGQVDRDLVEYATAVCLIEQKDDAYLKEQGYSWSSIAIHGKGYSPSTLSPIDTAVKKRLAQGDMIVVHDESAASGSKALPLVFCVRVSEAPAVRAAIDAIRMKLRDGNAGNK